MQRSSMNNSFFAQRAWSRLRASRPLSRMHPSDEKRFEALRQKEQVQGGQVQISSAPCSQQDRITPELPLLQQEGYPAMIKLNCGVSRKVGEPNYGSRGASVNVELELDSATVQDPKLLHEKIRKIFALAKTSVDEELGVGTTGTSQQLSQPSNVPAPSQTGPVSNGNSAKPATEGQLRAIWAICNQLELDQDAEAQRTFRRPVSQLTAPEASKLIDHLKQVQDASGAR